MNDINNHTPDGKFGSGDVDVDGGQAAGIGHQPNLVECALEATDQHFAVQGGYDDLAAGGFCGAVDYDDVPVSNTCADHGVAVYTQKEGTRLFAEELIDFHNCIEFHS